MDYIRREDLREEMVVVPSNTYEQGWNDALRSVYRNAQSVDGWIPVSVRLPEYEEEVLCQLEDGMAVLYREDNWGQDIWVDGGFGTGEYEVVAWMPLPEPYKAEKEVSE